MDIEKRITEILARSTISNDNSKLSDRHALQKEISGTINIIGSHNVVIDLGHWFVLALLTLFAFCL